MREIEEEERKLDELEALIVKRVTRGEGKCKGKLPLKCFSCNKIGHFVSRCLERVPKPRPNKLRFQRKCYYHQ